MIDIWIVSKVCFLRLSFRIVSRLCLSIDIYDCFQIALSNCHLGLLLDCLSGFVVKDCLKIVLRYCIYSFLFNIGFVSLSYDCCF